jgi:anti-sigma B factor antagonist
MHSNAGHDRRLDASLLAVVNEDTTRARVRLEGELDAANRDELVHLIAQMRDDGLRHVVLDVSGLTFCDAAGLHALHAGQQHLDGHGGSLVMTGVGTSLARLLALTGLDGVLHVTPSSGSRDGTRGPRA